MRAPVYVSILHLPSYHQNCRRFAAPRPLPTFHAVRSVVCWCCDCYRSREKYLFSPQKICNVIFRAAVASSGPSKLMTLLMMTCRCQWSEWSLSSSTVDLSSLSFMQQAATLLPASPFSLPHSLSLALSLSLSLPFDAAIFLCSLWQIMANTHLNLAYMLTPSSNSLNSAPH